MKLGQGGALSASEIASRIANRPVEDVDQRGGVGETNAPVRASSESFIASVTATRRPPPLALNDIAPHLAGTGVTEIFKSELDDFSRKKSDDIAGSFAELFLEFAETARTEGDRDLDKAFDFLGETMMNYEHLRLVRTGQLG